jgi:hypothetical protein
LVGKLRYGYQLGPPEDSYRYTKKVDDWRIGKGHTWTDIKNQIQAVPEYNMTDEEWTDIMDRWNYLNVPTTPLFRATHGERSSDNGLLLR